MNQIGLAVSRVPSFNRFQDVSGWAAILKSKMAVETFLSSESYELITHKNLNFFDYKKVIKDQTKKKLKKRRKKQKNQTKT